MGRWSLPAQTTYTAVFLLRIFPMCGFSCAIQAH